MVLSIDERQQLRDSARQLLDRYASPEAVRALLDDPLGFEDDLWRQVAELGWLGISLPEPYGAGGCLEDMSVVLYEIGAHLAGIPLVASAVLSAQALVMCDNEEVRTAYLGALADGTLRATVASASSAGFYHPPQLTVGASFSGKDVHLNGTSGFVSDAHVADIVIVVGRDTEDRILAAVVDLHQDGVTVNPTEMSDLTRRFAAVSFEDVVVPASNLLCEPGDRSSLLAQRLVTLGAISFSCDAVGVVEKLLDRTVAYATDRRQFGRAIGSFQAVKHHCADMAIALVASRSAVNAAMASYDALKDDAEREAAITKSYVGPACSDACGIAVQIHGGIGFTWENDTHLYFKRAKLDEMLFGTPRWHRRRLAETVFTGADPGPAAAGQP
jgi:alkylation response protein AidB-like acyl-CoA dehydrogenase